MMRPSARWLPSSGLFRYDRTFYCVKHHLWYGFLLSSPFVGKDENHTSFTLSPPTCRLHVGLTAHGWDHYVGDVTRIESMLDPRPEPVHAATLSSSSIIGLPRKVQKGDTILQIHWEGYQQSAADELYHAVWASIEGVQVLTSPVAATVRSTIPPDHPVHDLDQHTVLVDLEVEMEDLPRSVSGRDQGEGRNDHQPDEEDIPPTWVHDQDLYQTRCRQQAAGRFAELV